VRTGVGKGSVEDFINRFGRRCRAVTVATVSRAAFAPGRFGLGFGSPLGEGGGLAFGLPARLVEFSPRLGQLTVEAFVLQMKTFVFLAKLFELGAQVVALRQEGRGHGHRIADFD
jgi:hypothetical protein